MKKIVSLLLILCCFAFFIVPVLATEKYDLTDGEMLCNQGALSIVGIPDYRQAGRVPTDG